MLQDLENNLELSQLIAPANKTSGENSSQYDTANVGAVMLAASIGASGDTINDSNYIELEVEHSDDGNNWEDVDDADLTNSVDGTNKGTFAHIDASGELNQLYKTTYIGGKRYVRVVTNLTGTHSSGTVLGVHAVGGHLRKTPA